MVNFLRRVLAARHQRQLFDQANAYLGDALVFVEARDVAAARVPLRRAFECAIAAGDVPKASAIARAQHACRTAA